MLIDKTPVFLSAQGDETLWELIKEVIDDLFSLDLGTYQNLGIPDSMLSGLRGVIVALYIGVIFASFAAVFNKKSRGSLVRKLIECGCNSPENAKTLSELGLERSALVKSAIKSKSAYRGTIFCVEKEEYDKKVTRGRSIYLLRAAEEGEKKAPYEPSDYQYDFSAAHFYIPDSLRYEAEFRFQKRGSGIGSAIFVTIASLVLMWATIKIAPDILQFFDNFVGRI